MQVLRVSSRGEVTFTLLPLLEVVISNSFEMGFQRCDSSFIILHNFSLYTSIFRQLDHLERLIKKIEGYLKALGYGV